MHSLLFMKVEVLGRLLPKRQDQVAARPSCAADAGFALWLAIRMSLVPRRSVPSLGGIAHVSTQWPIYKVLGLTSGLLQAVGFVGLWLCKYVREHQGLTEPQFMETTSGSFAIWSASACFVLGLLWCCSLIALYSWMSLSA